MVVVAGGRAAAVANLLGAGGSLGIRIGVACGVEVNGTGCRAAPQQGVSVVAGGRAAAVADLGGARGSLGIRIGVACGVEVGDGDGLCLCGVCSGKGQGGECREWGKRSAGHGRVCPFRVSGEELGKCAAAGTEGKCAHSQRTNSKCSPRGRFRGGVYEREHWCARLDIDNVSRDTLPVLQ